MLPRDLAQQRALARAVRADDAHALAPVHLEAHVLVQRQAVIAHAQPLGVQHDLPAAGHLAQAKAHCRAL